METITITVEDPADFLTERGVSPSSTYAELFWLPVIGPSALLMGRRIEDMTRTLPSGESLEVSAVVLGQCLGLGAGVGKNAPVVRTFMRLVKFGLLVPEIAEGHVRFRRLWPPINRRQADRLPLVLQDRLWRWPEGRLTVNSTGWLTPVSPPS